MNQNSTHRARMIRMDNNKKRHTEGDVRITYLRLTLGKSEAISVTAEWIFSEHGTKLERRHMC